MRIRVVKNVIHNSSKVKIILLKADFLRVFFIEKLWKLTETFQIYAKNSFLQR